MSIVLLLRTLQRNKTGPILIGIQIALTLTIVCNSVFIIQQYVRHMNSPSGIDEANVLTLTNSWLVTPDDLEARIKGDLAALRASHGDDDLSLGVSFSLVPESIRDLTQGVTPIDDRRDLSGFDEILQDGQVLAVVPHDEHAHPLAHERRKQERPDLTTEPEPATNVRYADHDIGTPRGQRPPAVR